MALTHLFDARMLLSLILLIACSSTQQTMKFNAISTLNAFSGKSIVGAQWIAIQEINNRTDLLPNLNLTLGVYDSDGESGTALLHALNVIDTAESESNTTNFPIILGAPWSSISTITAPALGAFSNGQISSGATSISLSDTSRYPYFYRTIPSDALQAQGIILLCQQFNWTKIAVVYVQDAYGLYLSIGISSGGLAHGIEVTSIGFARDETSTFDEAAQQIKNANVYIIVFIIHDSEIRAMFDAFDVAGLTGYPYLYIGVDAWFDSPTLSGNNIEKYAQGSIGTVPWQTDALPLEEYDDDLQPLINASLQTYNALLTSWSEYWNAGYSDNLFTEFPSTTAIYGYDSMYTLAHALDIYLKTVNDDIENLNISALNDIIINDIKFVGASGEITFDSNGDRAEGLYAFGNVVKDADIEYFGYFYEQSPGNLTLSVNYDHIVWPKYFIEKGITPRSEPFTQDEIVDIAKGVLIPMYVLCVLSMCIVLILVALSWKYRKEPVVKAASPNINLIMLFGAFFGYIAMLIYGIDEQAVSEDEKFAWMWLCNLRLWMWEMSYTLLFMPLFAKTYRLSRIFNEILEKKCIYDRDLIKGIAFCLCVDLVLLTLYTAIEPLQRMYIGFEYEQIDELKRVHYIYGSCETNNNSQYIFYGLLSLWKCIESLFGIYCALSVSRIQIGGHALSQFDETSQQLLSIIFLIVALCIALPIGILGSDHPSTFYAVVGFLTISVGNVTTLLNVFPRILALIMGDADAKYRQSPQEKMESLIKAQFKKYGLEHDWKIKNTIDETMNRSDAVGSKMEGTTHSRLSIRTQTSGAATKSDGIVLPIVHDDTEFEGGITIRGLDRKISSGPDDKVDVSIDTSPKNDDLVKKSSATASATPVYTELATHLSTNDAQDLEQNIEEAP